MKDERIIKELFNRLEDVLKVLKEKYEKPCMNIAMKLVSKEDAEECVNDTFLAVWNQIPPNKPDPLCAYIFRITKNLALKKYHTNTAKKRNNYYDFVLDELEMCIPDKANVESEILAKELEKYINSFIESLADMDRVIFVKRYYFLKEIPEIAMETGRSKNYVTVHLHRLRTRLKKYLSEKGWILWEKKMKN